MQAVFCASGSVTDLEVGRERAHMIVIVRKDRYPTPKCGFSLEEGKFEAGGAACFGSSGIRSNMPQIAEEGEVCASAYRVGG